MSIINPPPKKAIIHIFEIINEETITPEPGKYFYKVKFLDSFFHEGKAIIVTDKPIEEGITLTKELTKQLKEIRKKTLSQSSKES